MSTIFGTPVAGVFLLALNHHRLEQDRFVFWTLKSGLALALGALLTGVLIFGIRGAVAIVLVTPGVVAWGYQCFDTKFMNHRAKGGARAPHRLVGQAIVAGWLTATSVLVLWLKLLMWTFAA